MAELADALGSGPNEKSLRVQISLPTPNKKILNDFIIKVIKKFIIFIYILWFKVSKIIKLKVKIVWKFKI